MARYLYDIAGDYPFLDNEGLEHPCEGAAWRDAVRLIRDAEENLQPGGNWSLTVRQDDPIVYRIEIIARGSYLV